MTKKRICGLLIFIFVMTGNACPAEELVLFGNENKPPKIYSENGMAKGILVDITRYIEKQIGISLLIELYPWARAYQKAKNQQGGIIGLSKTEARIKIFDYSDVMYHEELLLVVKKENAFEFDQMSDLKGKNIGAVRGSTYGDIFENGKKSGLFSVSEDNNPVLRLRKLLANRIDVALIGPGKSSVDWVIQQDQELVKRKSEFFIVTKPFTRDPNYLGIAKELNKKELIQRFNAALKKGYDSGKIQMIINGYADQN